MGQSIFFKNLPNQKIQKIKKVLNFDYGFFLHTVHTGIPVSNVTSTFDE